MNQSKLDEIREHLQKKQSGHRFEHTIGVMYTSAALAMRYEADMEQALMAGLLHDCAKSYTGQEMLEMCVTFGLEISEAEKAAPWLLHAKLGAYFAEHEYGIKEEMILSAITWHTTGKPKMSLLDKIVFVADYIEPNRNEAPNLTQLRTLAFQDLDECLYLILKQTLSYLQSKNAVIDPMTEITYQYYKERRE